LIARGRARDVGKILDDGTWNRSKKKVNPTAVYGNWYYIFVVYHERGMIDDSRTARVVVVRKKTGRK